jgi:hypothetical protein
MKVSRGGFLRLVEARSRGAGEVPAGVRIKNGAPRWRQNRFRIRIAYGRLVSERVRERVRERVHPTGVFPTGHKEGDRVR